MSDSRIRDRRIVWTNPYLSVVEKSVVRGTEHGAETFWSVNAGGYVAVVAVTREGLIPLVRQFRPAVETDVLELPSGAIDPGETPEQAARRELREETGCEAGELELLGRLHVDSGRLETRQWAYFAADVRVADNEWAGEEALELSFVRPRDLRESIVRGDFDLAAHVAIVGIAALSGRLAL